MKKLYNYNIQDYSILSQNLNIMDGIILFVSIIFVLGTIILASKTITLKSKKRERVGEIIINGIIPLCTGIAGYIFLIVSQNMKNNLISVTCYLLILIPGILAYSKKEKNIETTNNNIDIKNEITIVSISILVSITLLFLISNIDIILKSNNNIIDTNTNFYYQVMIDNKTKIVIYKDEQKSTLCDFHKINQKNKYQVDCSSYQIINNVDHTFTLMKPEE